MDEIESRLAETLQTVLEALEETKQRLASLEESPRSPASSPEQRNEFWVKYQAAQITGAKLTGQKVTMPAKPACIACERAGLLMAGTQFLIHCKETMLTLPVGSGEIEAPAVCSLSSEWSAQRKAARAPKSTTTR